MQSAKISSITTYLYNQTVMDLRFWSSEIGGHSWTMNKWNEKKKIRIVTLSGIHRQILRFKGSTVYSTTHGLSVVCEAEVFQSNGKTLIDLQNQCRLVALDSNRNPRINRDSFIEITTRKARDRRPLAQWPKILTWSSIRR